MSGYYPSYGGVGVGAIPSQPDYTAALGRVQVMSNDKLQELLDDESKCEEFVRSLEQVKSLYSEKEMLLASNKSLAEYNLGQEPKIREARSRLQEKHNDALQMTGKVKQLKNELDSKAGKMEPDVLLALLQAACAQVEEESEEVAKDYMSKRIENVDEFLDKFMEKRKLSHLRRIKIEKMKELLKSSPSGSASLTPVRPAPRPPPAAAIYSPPVAAPSNNWGRSSNRHQIFLTLFIRWACRHCQEVGDTELTVFSV